MLLVYQLYLANQAEYSKRGDRGLIPCYYFSVMPNPLGGRALRVLPRTRTSKAVPQRDLTEPSSPWARLRAANDLAPLVVLRRLSLAGAITGFLSAAVLAVTPTSIGGIHHTETNPTAADLTALMAVAPNRTDPYVQVTYAQFPDAPESTGGKGLTGEGDQPVRLEAYVVASGDTLSMLAEARGIDVASIAAANPGIDLNLLAIGQTLQMPNSVIQNAPKVATATKAKTTTTTAAKTATGGSTVRSVATTKTVKCELDYGRPIAGGSVSQTYSKKHGGVDISTPVGTAAAAIFDGEVVTADASGWNGGYGKMIVIRSTACPGVTTLYAHLSKIYVEVGQSVSRGDIVAATGNTGRSTGPHIHWELEEDGVNLNPNR